MKAIWKFPLAVKDVQAIAMPVGAEVLSVDVQREVPQLWALVDPEAEVVDRWFFVVGTGHSMPEPVGTYRGTFLIFDGDLVFHVFEQPIDPHPLADGRVIARSTFPTIRVHRCRSDRDHQPHYYDIDGDVYLCQGIPAREVTIGTPVQP